MLRELERQFIDALFSSSAAPSIQRVIEATDGRSAEAAFAVYRGSVYTGLTAALSAVYPVCRKLVGQRFFDALAERFITTTPSRSPDLTDYGGELADFIAAFAPAASLPYLADVARLEWAWHRAFNAADASSLNVRALQQVDEAQREQIVFALPDGSALVESAYPIHRIWEVNQDDFEGEATVDLDEGAVKLLVWRAQLNTRIDITDAPEWLFLSGVAQVMTFGELCSRFHAEYPDADLGNVFFHMIQRGWLASFHVHNA